MRERDSQKLLGTEHAVWTEYRNHLETQLDSLAKSCDLILVEIYNGDNDKFVGEQCFRVERNYSNGKLSDNGQFESFELSLVKGSLLTRNDPKKPPTDQLPNLLDSSVGNMRIVVDPSKPGLDGGIGDASAGGAFGQGKDGDQKYCQI